MEIRTNEINHLRGETNMIHHEHPAHPAPHPHPHPAPHHHHPHERSPMLRFCFNDSDCEILRDIFCDEDSTASAVSILNAAPPEIQLLAIQSIEAWANLSQVAQDAPAAPQTDDAAPAAEAQGTARENRVRWPNPVLDETTNHLFSQIYGENGYSFCAVLGTAPYEIAVVARILAHLNAKAGEMRNGHH